MGGATRTAEVEPIRLEAVVEPYEATADVVTVAIETSYYYLSAYQTAPEHREVSPG